jgi:hypothetical protein
VKRRGSDILNEAPKVIQSCGDVSSDSRPFDVGVWFRELDALREDSFMEEGRKQPKMPDR